VVAAPFIFGKPFRDESQDKSESLALVLSNKSPHPIKRP